MCNSRTSVLPQPSPNAPIRILYPSNFALDLRKCSILSRKRPIPAPVFPCQALFLSRSSQVPDSKPNRVSSLVRGSPPPICYPEYRVSCFLSRMKAGGLHPPAFGRMWERGITHGWPTSARSLGECGAAGNAWPMWVVLSASSPFNPCIFKFLPRNIGGGGIPAIHGFSTPEIPRNHL